MILVFWVAVALVGYTYLLYPAVVFLASRFLPEPISDPSFQPTVSIIMSLYNEDPYVLAKLENLRSLSYPPGRVQLLIGSDGSTDGTNAILGETQNVPPPRSSMKSVGPARRRC